MELRVFLTRDEKECPVGMWALVRDITGRKQVENATHRLEAVLRDSNDAVMLQDFNGNIMAWNRAAERIYDYSEADALAINIRKIIPKEQLAKMQHLVSRVAKGETLEPFETTRLAKGGRPLRVLLTITALKDDAGNVTSIATTEREINKVERT